MAEKIDVSKVSIKDYPHSGDVNPENAGIWHNYFLYKSYNTPQELDWTDDYTKWCDLLINIAQVMEREDNLPSGSVLYVTKISDTIRRTDPENFKPTIEGLKSIFDELKSDTKYSKTALTAVASIAYHSSVFWSEVTEVVDGTTSKMKWPKWLIKLCKDIAGALAGGSAGLSVGTFLGGPVGAVVGLCLGISAGAIGGSGIS